MNEVWILHLPREDLYFSKKVYAAMNIQAVYPEAHVDIRPFSRVDEFGCFINQYEMIAVLKRKDITQ